MWLKMQQVYIQYLVLKKLNVIVAFTPEMLKQFCLQSALIFFCFLINWKVLFLNYLASVEFDIHQTNIDWHKVSELTFIIFVNKF